MILQKHTERMMNHGMRYRVTVGYYPGKAHTAYVFVEPTRPFQYDDEEPNVRELKKRARQLLERLIHLEHDDEPIQLRWKYDPNTRSYISDIHSGPLIPDDQRHLLPQHRRTFNPPPRIK